MVLSPRYGCDIVDVAVNNHSFIHSFIHSLVVLSLHSQVFWFRPFIFISAFAYTKCSWVYGLKRLYGHLRRSFFLPQRSTDFALLGSWLPSVTQHIVLKPVGAVLCTLKICLIEISHFHHSHYAILRKLKIPNVTWKMWTGHSPRLDAHIGIWASLVSNIKEYSSETRVQFVLSTCTLMATLEIIKTRCIFK